MMSRNPDISFISEYIKNVLYFATVRPGKVFKNTSEVFYFCTDKELVYENYYSDFGPLNLGCVYKFCKILNDKIKESLNKQSIVYYTSIDAKKVANAAFLLGCYGVLYLNLYPKEALKPLTLHGQTYRAFQDATQGDSNYTISLLDCLQSVKKARDLGFINFHDFNYEEYIRLDKIQGGDLNWIVPGKFLAFIGPVDYSVSLYHPPEMYIEYFRENNVKIVIRLNKKMYDGNVFSNAGITHYDLFFHDGTCPPKHILARFLQISEVADGAIAVHCKAGLGRTGSLIGSYLIKHYRMTAHEAIGWMRICRPGSVIGHQQAWLEQLEPWLIKQGNIYRKRNFQDTEKLPVHEYGIYSISEKATNQRLVLANKPSPLPQIQRQTRSDTTPPARSHGSRIREENNIGAPLALSEKQDDIVEPLDLNSVSVRYDTIVQANMFLKKQALAEIESDTCINLHKKRTFWQKYCCCCCNPYRSCNDRIWLAAVRCVRLSPKCLETTVCCDGLDRLCFDAVPIKASEKEQSECRVRASRGNAKVSHKGDLNRPSTGSVSRRVSGAGEPRPSTRSSSRGNVISVTTKDKSNDLNNRTYATYAPLPAFQTHSTAFRTFKDAKAYLLKPSAYEQREKQLNSLITVTPHGPSHYYRGQTHLTENLVSGFTGNNRPSPQLFSNTGVKCQTQSQTRRRLGRSPSPSPSASPTRYSEQSRATNTPQQIDKYLIDDSNFSKSTLREALSRLKLTRHREGSIGAASVGAASLGARREAPADKRAPSVRSDERPTATQGDMLNSIKFQRRFRETLNAEKISTAFQQKENSMITPKPKQSGASPTGSRMGTQPRTGYSTDSRWATARPNSPTKVRPIPNVIPSRFGTGYKAGIDTDNAQKGSSAARPMSYPNSTRPSSPRPKRNSPCFY